MTRYIKVTNCIRVILVVCPMLYLSTSNKIHSQVYEAPDIKSPPNTASVGSQYLVLCSPASREIAHIFNKPVLADIYYDHPPINQFWSLKVDEFISTSEGQFLKGNLIDDAGRMSEKPTLGFSAEWLCEMQIFNTIDGE